MWAEGERTRIVLHLKSKTPKAWAQEAVANIDVILLDHAHCEKKAASTALSLIFRYPEMEHMLRPLTAVAREELEHFECVLDHLEARGCRFEKLAPSPYAGRLLKILRTGEPDRLIDMLLCCAAIEARSCERMTLLADALTEPTLKEFYRSLLASEARHFMLYVDLALEIGTEDAVRARLEEVMEHEAEVLFLSGSGPRMHN